MGKKNIFDGRMAEILINLRHSSDCVDKFRAAEGHVKKMSSLWDGIAKEMSPDLSGGQVRDKYNKLYTYYKLECDKSNHSGNPVSSWKYYEVFNATAPENIKKIKMVEVLDVGNGDIPLEIIQTSPVPTISESEPKRKTTNEELNDQYIKLLTRQSDLMEKLLDLESLKHDIILIKEEIENLKKKIHK